MAQRRGMYRARRITRRLGLTAQTSVVAVLLTLGCVAGGAGVLGSMRAGGVTIERGAVVAQEGEDGGTGEGDVPGGADSTAEESEPTSYVVHVDGAVAAPGVVRVEGLDVRVFDAVEAAGGLLEDADTSTVNLAESLMDGAKIHIPREGEVAEAVAAVPESGQATTMGATGSGSSTMLVNLNTASAQDLQSLPGVGEVTAQTIVDDRERNGPFASPEDLMRVSGIGEKKFEKIRDLVCV